jgi:type VI secretion system secreted protein Hcp
MKRCSKWFGVLLVLTCAMSSGTRVVAAVDMFLKLADAQGTILIEGESTDSRHPKEIVVSSFSHGVSVPIDRAGGGVGKAVFSDINISKLLDKASPLLYSYAAQGKNIPQVVLTLRRNDAKPIEFYVITLTDVLISSVQTAGGGDIPSESLSLNYTKIEWRYVPQKADGSEDKPVVATWDLSANKP